MSSQNLISIDNTHSALGLTGKSLEIACADLNKQCFTTANSVSHCCESRCFGGWRIGDVLGAGAWGSVHVGCKQHSCMYAIKFVILDHRITFQGREAVISRAVFLKEIQDTELLGRLGVGPELFGYGMTGDVHSSISDRPEEVGYIVTERFMMTLQALKRDHPIIFERAKDSIIVAILKGVLIAEEHHISLNDIHADNIVVNVDDDGQISKLRLIDFGVNLAPPVQRFADYFQHLVQSAERPDAPFTMDEFRLFHKYYKLSDRPVTTAL